MTFSDLLHHFALYLKAVGHIYLTNKKTSQSANSVKWYVRNDAINHGNNMPQCETIEMRPPNSRQSSILQHLHIWWNQIETENKLVNKIIFFANLIKEKTNDFTTPNQVDTECSSQSKYLYNPFLLLPIITYDLLPSAFFLSFLYVTKTLRCLCTLFFLLMYKNLHRWVMISFSDVLPM
jgi:hypothetical protein